MTAYVTGGAIRALREKKGYTQKQLGELVGVSDKTVSKWEMQKGLPDISLLEPLEAEGPDGEHALTVEVIDGEYYVHSTHPMTKEHFSTFFARAASGRVDFLKLYPEQAAEGRFSIRGGGVLYACCSRHGLVCVKLPAPGTELSAGGTVKAE